MRTDCELQRAVEERLTWAPGIDVADVGVSVHDGVVQLTGTVRTFAEREVAKRAVLETESVLDVANEIQVDVPRHAHRTDQEIAHRIRNTLELHCRVPHQQSTQADVGQQANRQQSEWDRYRRLSRLPAGLMDGSRQRRSLDRHRTRGNLPSGACPSVAAA